MKIGIVTFYQSKDNYGQLLQCFALQTFLRNHGHNPFLIRFNADKKVVKSNSNRILKILKYIRHLNTYIELYKTQKRLHNYICSAQNEDRQFSSFIESNIVVSEHIYTEQELLECPPEADVYICGSDQIWGGNFTYYLNFAPEKSKKIAYAPSFGGVKSFSEEYESELKRLLSKFDFLGIREYTGVETCQRLGFPKAQNVVDPTLLLTQEDYEKIRLPKVIHERFIFVYLLGNPCDIQISKVYALAKKRNLKVVYVGSQGQYDKYVKCWATIPEWINYVAQADFVITNSFHCTVFALQYNRNFITIPLKGAYTRMNSRISELLSLCDLRDRIYDKSKSLEWYYGSDLSAYKFQDYISSEVEKSKKLLLKAVEN